MTYLVEKNKKHNLLTDIFEDPFFNNPLIPESIFKNFIDSKITGFPVWDKYEEEGKLVLRFALAGYKSEELNVEFQGTNLVVSGKQSENYREGSRIVLKDFKVSSMINDKALDINNTSVSFVDGLLKIEIPRKEPKKPEVKKLTIGS